MIIHSIMFRKGMVFTIVILMISVGLSTVYAVSILENISDILYDILPVIDIEYLLNKYIETGNVFEIPEVPPILSCFGIDNITVPVREEPFEAYNISLMGSSIGNIYYSPETGNIIKIAGNFKDVLPFVSDINAELVSYSYTPK